MILKPSGRERTIVEKKAVGASQGGLIHVATRQLFAGTQMVVNFWLLHNGFPIGIGDTIAHQNNVIHYPDNC